MNRPVSIRSPQFYNREKDHPFTSHRGNNRVFSADIPEANPIRLPNQIFMEKADNLLNVIKEGKKLVAELRRDFIDNPFWQAEASKLENRLNNAESLLNETISRHQYSESWIGELHELSHSILSDLNTISLLAEKFQYAMNKIASDLYKAKHLHDPSIKQLLNSRIDSFIGGMNDAAKSLGQMLGLLREIFDFDVDLFVRNYQARAQVCRVVDKISDAFRLLGLSAGASLREVKSAYRRLISTYHPDRDPSPEALEKSKMLNVAYELIAKHLYGPIIGP